MAHKAWLGLCGFGRADSRLELSVLSDGQSIPKIRHAS